MKHNTKYILLASVLALLAATGCQRESLDPTGNAIRYKVAVTDIATRGALVNNNDNSDYSDIALAGTLSPFRAAAYNGTSPVFTTSGLTPANVETVTYTDGSWTMPNTYYWPQATTLTFFAYGNLPTSGSSVAITSAGQTLTHAMVSAVADQKDILLGYYKGRGVAGNTAEIRFSHPLTAVFFKKGDFGDDAITSITLSDLAASGTVVMDADGIIGDWQDVSDYTATSSQSNSEGLTVDGTTNAIGDPFILIPQNLATNNVKLTVACKSGLTLETTIESGEWKAQKTNWYTLNYGDPTNWTLTVTPWGAGASGDMPLSESLDVKGDVLRNYDNTEGPVSYSLTSECPWKLQYTLDGTNWIDAVAGQPIGESGKEWVSFDVVSGAGDGIPATVTATVAAASGDPVTIETDHQKALREASPRGVESNPWDLSMHDIFGNFNTSGRTTANCYVVSAPGWYSFPLVYGNAIKNGAVNTDAFAPEAPVGTDEKLFLTPFKKADGYGISSPYITGATKAYPLWEDVPDYAIINNTAADCKIVGSGADAKVVFHVNRATLTQGNVVIAVSNGTDILWSWHIWVTDADLTPIPVKNYAGMTINMFPQNLGWVDAAVTTTATGYPAMSLDIRFVQTGGDRCVITKTVRRKEYLEETTETTTGSCPTWQHGRKDPFIRSNGRTNDELTAFSGTPMDKSKSASIGSGCDIEFGIKNPTFFVKQGSNTYHQWYIENNDTTNVYLNLWSALTTKDNKEGYRSKPMKTVYDPCPPGFQVPQGDAFSGFITTEDLECKDASKFNVVGAYAYGWNFKTGIGDKTIVFPAAGVRRATNGTLGYAGSAGCYWSAIPLCIIHDADSKVSVGLQFQSGEVSPLANHKRSWGYTIRPAQE